MLHILESFNARAMLHILESFNARAMLFVVVWSLINGCFWELICGAFILIYRFVGNGLFHPRPVNRIPIPLHSVSNSSISFFEMLRGRVTADP